MGFVTAMDPASKTTQAFTDIGQLIFAMEKLKYTPLRPDGTPFIVNFLVDENGYLLDGAPLNVWFDGVWYDGQQQVGQKYWGKQGVPTPSQQILALPVVPMPGDVAQTYQAFKAQAGGLLSSPWLWLAGGAAVLWFISGSGGGGGGRSAAAEDYGDL